MSNQPAIVIEKQPLRDLNWWRVGGEAEFFAAPSTIGDLRSVWHWGWQRKLPIHIISGGSNILVQEGLLKGLVISLHALKGIENVSKGGEALGSGASSPGTSSRGASSLTTSSPGASSPATSSLATAEDLTITCLAGTPKAEVAKVFMQNRLAPAIFLTGIPGDMGAGVVMNAGIGEMRTPREFCEIVRSVDVLRLDESTGEISEVTILGRDIHWEYRHSAKWQPGIIVRVTVGWVNAPDAGVSKEVVLQTKKRVSTQPLDQPNCGSVFRNPLGHKSAQLIEACGLKGFRVGGASVSQKHSNFIVNDQGATAQDVHAVIEHVRKTVLTQTGVELKTEVVYLGAW